MQRYDILFFFNDTATTEIYTLSLHDALPISARATASSSRPTSRRCDAPARESMANEALVKSFSAAIGRAYSQKRSEEHTSELQSRQYLVCRLLLEKKIIPQHHLPKVCVRYRL